MILKKATNGRARTTQPLLWRELLVGWLRRFNGSRILVKQLLIYVARKPAVESSPTIVPSEEFTITARRSTSSAGRLLPVTCLGLRLGLGAIEIGLSQNLRRFRCRMRLPSRQHVMTRHRSSPALWPSHRVSREGGPEARAPRTSDHLHASSVKGAERVSLSVFVRWGSLAHIRSYCAIQSEMGDPDKVDLQAELERTGWHVTRNDGYHWWEHECWELASTWRPIGTKAFLTFLVDPQSKATVVSSVWAVAVTSARPIDRLEAEQSAIRIAPRWPERMKEILEAARSLRPRD